MPEGDLHTGFSNAYGMLQSQIWQEIEKIKPKHIWITGHSLGGAMALVCAYDLSIYRSRNIDGVITFGQPMISKHNLANSLQNKLSSSVTSILLTNWMVCHNFHWGLHIVAYFCGS